LEYKITVTLPDELNGYDSLLVIDELPEVLSLENGVSDVTGTLALKTNVTRPLTEADGELSYDVDTNKLTFTFDTESDFAGLEGAVLTLYIAATVDKDAFADSGATSITNEAYVVLNGEEEPPSEPEVVVPLPPTDLLKVLADGQGAEIALSDLDEAVDYEVSFKMPDDTAGWTSLELRDVLPESGYLAM